MRYDIITPFNRPENYPKLLDHLSRFDNIRWLVATERPLPSISLPEWVEEIICPYVPNGWRTSHSELYWKINWLMFTRPDLITADRFCFLNDDDAYHRDFFKHLDNSLGSILIASMDRGDVSINAHVCTKLRACPENMQIASVGIEQAVFARDQWGSFVFPNIDTADGVQYSYLAKTRATTYVPQATVLFNYFEPGRYTVDRELP